MLNDAPTPLADADFRTNCYITAMATVIVQAGLCTFETIEQLALRFQAEMEQRQQADKDNASRRRDVAAPSA